MHWLVKNCFTARELLAGSSYWCQIPTISSSLFLRALLGPRVVLLINRVTLGYPFNNDYSSDVKENNYYAFSYDLLVFAFFSFSVKWGIIYCINCLFVYVGGVFNFRENYRLMLCSVFILATNLAENNTVTLKQSSEANQWYREMNP
jgi:hypothetical protein